MVTLVDSLEAPQPRVHRNGNIRTRMVQELPLQDLVGLRSATPLAALTAMVESLLVAVVLLPMLLYVVRDVTVVMEVTVVRTPPERMGASLSQRYCCVRVADMVPLLITVLARQLCALELDPPYLICDVRWSTPGGTEWPTGPSRYSVLRGCTAR